MTAKEKALIKLREYLILQLVYSEKMIDVITEEDAKVYIQTLEKENEKLKEIIEQL